MSEAAQAKPRGRSIPISISAAALTAFAMLRVTAGRSRDLPLSDALLPVLGALLLLTYATDWRLPPGRLYGYALRGLLFGAIIMMFGMPRESADFWYFKQEYTSLAGYLLAAEMVVQAWRWRDWSQPPEAAGVAILLTALIIAAASNTYRHRQVSYFVPIYVLMLIISLRGFGNPSKAPPHIARLVLLRSLLALAALALGYAVTETVNRYDYRITKFAMRMFNRPPQREEVGLADTANLGAVFNPKASLERVVVIEGSLSNPHLRALAFDSYENHVWGPMLHERSFSLIDTAELGAKNPGLRCEVTLLTDLSGLLIAPLDSAGIVSDTLLDCDDNAVLAFHDTQQNPAYQIVAPPHGSFQGALCFPLDPERRRLLLTIPPSVDPGVSKLARQVAGSGSAVTRLSRLADELREHHGYSLVFVPKGEPISDFVLNQRSAHCEYFASAMVIMARSVGIPARLVTGYYAHEREGNEIVVRGRDAHAWAECWIDGTGWVTVDATPSDGTPDALYPTTSNWRRWWDWIIDLPRLIKRSLARASRGTVLLVAGSAIVIALLVSLVRSWRARRKRIRPQMRSYPPPRADLAAAARRFERAVHRRGLVLLPHRTWRESLASAPVHYHDFIAVYDTLRFGAAGDVLRLNELLEQIEQEPRNPKP